MSDLGKESVTTAEAEIKNYKDDFTGLINTLEKRVELNGKIKKTNKDFPKKSRANF